MSIDKIQIAVMVFTISLSFFKIYSVKKIDKSHIDKTKGFEDIRYHNEKIYEDFKLFIQITTAIVTGIGILKTIGNPSVDITSVLESLKGIQLLATSLITIFIVSHQVSKMMRWTTVNLSHWWQWQETWMVIGILILGNLIYSAH